MITLKEDVKKEKPKKIDPFEEEVRKKDKFRIGDKVKVVGDIGEGQLFKDKEFIIHITTLSETHPYNLKGVPLLAFSEEQLELVEEKKKESKYKAKKVEYKGIVFDSTSERDYYIYLEEQKELGNVKAFRVQPKFTLLPPFQTEDLVTYKGTSYISDFEVMYADGSIEVIDIKGFATPMSKVKKKLFHFFYPNVKLTWLVKNRKFGESNGFIEFNKLEQIRSKNRKEKKLKEESENTKRKMKEKKKNEKGN